MKPRRKAWQRESECSLRFPQVFIIQNGKRPQTQEERVESDSTERLRENNSSSHPALHLNNKQTIRIRSHVALCFSAAFILSRFFYICECFCNPHTRDGCTAQLCWSKPSCSTLTQLRQTRRKDRSVKNHVMKQSVGSICRMYVSK